MLTEAEMNREFEIIWDCAVAERLQRGDLNVEMDLQGIFRAELEKKGLIGPDNPFWRCYHDLMLLVAPHKVRYDIVLMKYEQPTQPELHIPSVVGELKIWNDLQAFQADLEKIEKLYGELYPFPSRPYAAHVLCIVDVVPTSYNPHNKPEAWEDRLRELSGEGYHVVVRKWYHKLANQLLLAKTKLCQWGRYGGDTDRMDWVPAEGRSFERRQLWQVRVTRLAEA